MGTYGFTYSLYNPRGLVHSSAKDRYQSVMPDVTAEVGLTNTGEQVATNLVRTPAALSPPGLVRPEIVEEGDQLQSGSPLYPM